MAKQKYLQKRLGLYDVFCIASGAMISSGLFILPGLAYLRTGPSLFLSYIFAGVLAVPAMLSNAELTTAMPRAGGDYFFISRSMGQAMGTLGGLSSWFSLSLKSAFALMGVGAYAALVIECPMNIFAGILCVIFVVLNICGLKEASFVQRILVTTLFIILGIYVIKGVHAVDIKRFIPFIPFGTAAVFQTAGFVFISYGGLTKIASVAEEVKNPGRNIPLGMIMSIFAVGLFYALAVFVTTGVLDPESLKTSEIPISAGAAVFMEKPGMILMAVAAMLAFVSTANAGIISASRYPIAMARDRILPHLFKKTHDRFYTPHNSIILTGAFIIVAIFLLDLMLLVEVASTFLIILFFLANLAVIIMRESGIQNYQPKFRSPLYPWIQIIGMISSVFLLVEMGLSTYVITMLFIAASLIWYMVYVRPRVKSDFALVHLIKRITAKELSSSFLTRELMEIIRERDNIVEDRFDKMVSRCKILDIDSPLTMNDFFRIASESLSPELETDADKIYGLMIARERQTSTVIRPGLAIPHIIVEKNNKFSIILARCKGGIQFPKEAERVHAVFVLAGSKEERNFHLRALAAIAEIAQAKNFDKIWMGARNKEALRDIILLSERRRFTSK